MLGQKLEPMEKRIKDNKMSKLKIGALCLLALAVFFSKPIYNYIGENSFLNWQKSDFYDRHSAIFAQVIEYTKTGDYDLALNYLNDAKQNDMYQYLNKSEKHEDLIQEYVYLNKTIKDIDDGLRNNVKKFYYHEKNINIMDVWHAKNSYVYFITNIASREDISTIERVMNNDFHEYHNNKGILYKYKLKMEQ